MSYRDVRGQDVLAAIARFDEVGRDAFLERYGYDKARRFVVVHNGKQYDSKAIVGVAHEFLDGRALTPGEFSGGHATVGLHLRGLGFVVQERRDPQQLLLQPRGGARDGGPGNFKRTIEKGVRLADHADAFGEDLAELQALYRDGTAKLWGNTPPAPAKQNSLKAKAIRGRRVGDRVLFYAKRTFIAEAVILKLFHNPAAARSIWGADKTGETFEHMMALGDVRLIREDATDLVLRATRQETLRSVTLVPAGKFVTPTEQPKPTKPSPDGPFSVEQHMTELLTLHSPERSAKSESVALLWTIGQVGDKPRLHPLSTFRQGVSMVLTACGVEGADEVERPFYDLRRTSFWRIDPEETPSSAANAPEPRAGFTDEFHRLLMDVSFRTKAINALRSRHLDDIEDHESLLASVGLGDYLTVSGGPQRDADTPGERRRRPNQGSSVVRDPKVVKKVKALYDHTCQFCGTRLSTGFGYYSEAAHIRGLTVHTGPDDLENLLCLCANCHVQFDGYGLYVDEDYVVRRVRDRVEVGKLRVVPDHPIDAAHITYHRELCVIAPPTSP
ncbi:putative restriction endonuclease [Saccharothrix ecbatanensis]|uniref:Putative restriction endonuclease n=1 Tax=Saccharothrix ecbatanensis TaxID=1105145 RepID=A0A7W9HN41_9PSEU|nr:HNH endonuclease [Saccharothrix ecbatanensis]MBB5804953.1 putative restriction endonuclease [Saccharothrix ecbatanensis]